MARETLAQGIVSILSNYLVRRTQVGLSGYDAQLENVLGLIEARLSDLYDAETFSRFVAAPQDTTESGSLALRLQRVLDQDEAFRGQLIAALGGRKPSGGNKKGRVLLAALAAVVLIGGTFLVARATMSNSGPPQSQPATSTTAAVPVEQNSGSGISENPATVTTSHGSASTRYSDKVFKFSPPAQCLDYPNTYIDFDTAELNGDKKDLVYDCEAVNDHGAIVSKEAKQFGDAPQGQVTAESCRDAARTGDHAQVELSAITANVTAWCVITHSNQVALVKVTGKGEPFSVDRRHLPTMTLQVTLWSEA